MTAQYAGKNLQRGVVSRRVITLRERLLRAGISISYLAPDAVLDPTVFDDHVDAAVRAFQQARGLIVDGIVGIETERSLNEAQFKLGDRVLSYQGEAGVSLQGDDVAELQRQLSHLGFYYGHIDGAFGHRAMLAVRELQLNLGLPPTGTCDHQTIDSLARVNRTISPSKAFSLRDLDRLNQASAALRGRIVALDPVWDERGPSGVRPRLTASRVSFQVAAAVARMLADFGAQAVLTRGETKERSLADRIDIINSSGAGINLTFQCEFLPNSAAQGVSAYYWGEAHSGDIRSPIGERAAGLIQREVVARTGMLDLGVHGRSWQILKAPRVASIGIDLGYLSNQEDALRLASPRHQDIVASSIVFGLQRLFLFEEDEHPTGTMHVDDVRRFNRNA